MRPFAEWTKVVGHRGSAGSTPENTLISIREAADVGARAVQFDVALSRDGIPMLLHDESLHRIVKNGDGHVSDFTMGQLKELDAGSWFLPQFGGEPIPTLEEALRLCAVLELRILPTLRPQPGEEDRTTRAAIDVLQELWPLDHSFPLLNSTNPLCIATALEVQPDWPRGLVFDTLPSNWRDIVDQTQPTTLQGDARNPTALLELVASGKPVYASLVNDVKRARSLFAIGIFGIITDYPAQMLFQSVQVRMPF